MAFPIIDIIIEGTITLQGSDITTLLNNLPSNIVAYNNHISSIANPHSVTKSQVGLGNVDNTSDVNKPVSNDVQTALNTKANISGQTFTGNISAPNLSNTNTGDETIGTIQTKRPLKTINTQSLEGVGDISVTGGDTLVTEGALINSATSKATPIDTDQVGLMDSADSNILKKLSWVNIKAALKTFFDNLYATKVVTDSIFIEPWNIAPSAVTTPTAAAATTSLLSSVVGQVVVAYSGTTDQNANATFQIPKNYKDGGSFKLYFDPATTSGGSVIWTPIIMIKSVGDIMNTQTETLIPQTVLVGTANTLTQTANFTPVALFAIGDIVSVRITRDASADSYNGVVNLVGFEFVYNTL